MVRPEAPFTRRELQIHFERNGVQTRPIFTGNVLRQPGFRSLREDAAPEEFPNADRVMRTGILIGCHHGLSDGQVGYIHDAFRAFV
jgi:CDP-6-deoxy-D-xylo-4-hexulose-3-dehydrase